MEARRKETAGWVRKELIGDATFKLDLKGGVGDEQRQKGEEQGSFCSGIEEPSEVDGRWVKEQEKEKVVGFRCKEFWFLS